MLLSRGTHLLRVAKFAVKQNSIVPKQQVRNYWHGQWAYREPGKPVRAAYIMSELCGGFLIWWILWHCYHDWHHLVGFDLPEPEDWADADLGIPLDDADC